MQLLCAGPSPYAAKAAMAAKFASVDVEMVEVDATNGDERLSKATPLERIPCLVLEDGTGLFDSRVITRHLDRVSNGKLFGSGDAALTAERMEALCDGINDSLVGAIYERRMRPEEKVHQPWIDRLLDKAMRGLDVIMDDLPPTGADAHMGSIALAATLGYLDLRYAGQWEDGRDALKRWQTDFAKSHPETAALAPRG